MLLQLDYRKTWPKMEPWPKVDVLPYFRKFRKILPKKISSNIWTTLNILRSISKNLENYSGKFQEIQSQTWPPLVSGLPGLHDNAPSADACRWSVVTNAIRIHVKLTHLWKLVKKSGIGLSIWIFFPLDSENGLLCTCEKNYRSPNCFISLLRIENEKLSL